MTCAKVVACLVVTALLGGLVFTQETSKGKRPKNKDVAPSAAAKPISYKVEKKPFKIELTLKGILQAEETAPISYRPQPTVQPPPSQGPLTIRQIVPHGTKVKAGEMLVAFDTRKIDDVIADLETEKKVLEANIKLAEEELPLFQKSVPIDLAVAETAKKRADDDLKYFVEVGRPEAEKGANFSVKSAKFFLESEQEQLRQLQKMYKANDLTEDTEKIILRRQEFYVEMADFFYKAELIYRDHTLNQTLPNQDKTLRENQVKQTLQLEKARKTLAPMAFQKQEALVKMRFDREKNRSRLDKIRQDRAAMTIQSPFEGVVYHGKFHKGQWTVSDALENKLVANGTVAPEEVFLTVVKPRPVVVHLTVEEKDAYLIKPGLDGKARMLFHPDRKLAARVTKVSSVPAAPGKFDAQVVLDHRAMADLMPGMACSVKFVPYAKDEALVVPSAAVHDEDDRYVVHVAKQGKPEKREVTPGRSNGEHTEILSGLQEGEEILVERPGAKMPAGTKSGAQPQEKGKTL
jgi:multidrug efflux pump subunit AcrA (membrane-fusion protein)